MPLPTSSSREWLQSPPTGPNEVTTSGLFPSWPFVVFRLGFPHTLPAQFLICPHTGWLPTYAPPPAEGRARPSRERHGLRSRPTPAGRQRARETLRGEAVRQGPLTVKGWSSRPGGTPLGSRTQRARARSASSGKLVSSCARSRPSWRVMGSLPGRVARLRHRKPQRRVEASHRPFFSGAREFPFSPWPECFSNGAQAKVVPRPEGAP